MKEHPNYEVFEEIGRGSSATVYRAHDLSLKRDVAIKELSEKLRKDPRRMQDFWDEAQFLAGIRHENIVQIHAIDQERGWIIMELMRNSLDNLVENKGLPPDLVRSVLQQALQALECLHGKDKLHAGVRPASLLIDDQGRIKLSDSAGITVGGEFRKPTGSSKYLAPELVNPQFGPVGPGVDLYNLGFAALELLLGRNAFEKYFKGVGPGAVDPEIGWMRWHSSPVEKLPSVRDMAPGLPEDMVRVLQKLTRKDVAQRYGSAAEALADLENRDLVLVREEDRGRRRGARPAEGPAVVAVGAAPPVPPPSAPVPARPAPPPGKTRPNVTKGPRPWSKDWLNQQLKKPAVLLPVLLLLMAPVAYVLFFTGEQDPPLAPGVTFTVDSTPQGANVFVFLKEKWVKAKNATKTSIMVPPGDYKIKLELPDHETLGKTIRLTKEEDFTFELKRTSPATPGRDVVLVSDPAGAEIYIDGKKLDKVTGEKIKAPAFPYRLKLVYKGKTVVERTIRSLEEESATLRPDPAPSTVVEIRSEPAGAYVHLNGKKQERKTNDKFEVAPGPLEVVLTLEGFKTFRQKFDKIPENLPLFKLTPGKDGFRQVYIATDPPGAIVFIDKVRQTKPTPDTFEVPEGPFDLRLEKGKRLLEKTVAAASPKEFFKLPAALRPLFIETTPPGSVVFIDDEKQEKLTNETYMVPDEPFTLKLVGPAGIPEVIPLSTKIDPEEIDKKFTHSFLRKMYLTSFPEGATVYINDRKQADKTNGIFEVPAVPFSLKLELDGRRVEKEVEPAKIVAMKKDPKSKVPIPEIELKLPPASISVLVKTVPIGAKIEIVVDEKKKPLEEVGPAKVNLAEGVYPIVVSKKGYKTYKGELRIKEGVTEEEVTLSALTTNYYALMVGVHDYGEMAPDFLHAESDTEAIADLLKVGDFAPERVFVLTQTRGKAAAALAPSAENILDKLKFLADTCTEVDTVWVGLFGQVLSTPKGDFFWPAGGDKSKPETLVPMPKILKELQRCPAQTKVLLLDGWRFHFGLGMEEQPFAVREYRPAKEDLHGIFFVASCQPGQKGYGEMLKRHGLFGLSMLRALSGQADGNKDERVTGMELETFLKDVSDTARKLYRAEQTPSVDDPGLNPGALVVARITPSLKSIGLAREAIREKKGDVAQKHLNDVLKAHPDFARGYLHRSEAAYVDGRIKDARDDLSVALKLDPSLGLAWSNLGDVQFELEDPEAFESHSRAIELEPEFGSGYRDRAFLHIRAAEMKRGGDAAALGHLDKAIEDLKKAVKLNPRHALAWHDLGRAHTWQAKLAGGEFDPALEAFGRAIELSLNPRDQEASYFERAEAYQARARRFKGKEEDKYKDDVSAALKDYKELVNFKSKDEDKYYNVIGSLHNQLGNLPEAARNFETATRINDRFKVAFLNLGAVHINLREYAKAIPALERAVMLDEKYGKAHLFLSVALSAQAKLNPAMRAELEEKARYHQKIAKSLGAK